MTSPSLSLSRTEKETSGHLSSSSVFSSLALFCHAKSCMQVMLVSVDDKSQNTIFYATGIRPRRRRRKKTSRSDYATCVHQINCTQFLSFIQKKRTLLIFLLIDIYIHGSIYTFEAIRSLSAISNYKNTKKEIIISIGSTDFIFERFLLLLLHIHFNRISLVLDEDLTKDNS